MVGFLLDNKKLWLFSLGRPQVSGSGTYAKKRYADIRPSEKGQSIAYVDLFAAWVAGFLFKDKYKGSGVFCQAPFLRSRPVHSDLD
jgi:hypothetical protein